MPGSAQRRRRQAEELLQHRGQVAIAHDQLGKGIETEMQ